MSETYFRSKMKKETHWFITDLGYDATKDKLLKYRHLFSGDCQDSRGRLSFRFKDLKDVTFQVTTNRKLGVFSPKGLDLELALKKILPYLVKPDGSQAKIIGRIEIPKKSKPLKKRNLLEIEQYFEEHPYWQHKVLDDTDVMLICDELGLNPKSMEDVELIYRVHSRYKHKRRPAIFG